MMDETVTSLPPSLMVLIPFIEEPSSPSNSFANSCSCNVGVHGLVMIAPLIWVPGSSRVLLPAQRLAEGASESCVQNRSDRKKIAIGDRSLKLAVVDRDLPAADRDLPAVDRDLPAVDRDLPAADRDLPAADRDLP